MTQQFFAGVAVGLTLGMMFWIAWIIGRKQILLYCSVSVTPEKIGKGFYYIVPEKDFMELSNSHSLQKKTNESMH